MDPQVPDHRKWERSETAELEAASEIGNIHCLRSPGHPVSSQSPTLPQAHTSVTLCHSNLGQAISWAWTVFSNRRARRASGP